MLTKDATKSYYNYGSGNKKGKIGRSVNIGNRMTSYFSKEDGYNHYIILDSIYGTDTDANIREAWWQYRYNVPDNHLLYGRGIIFQ